MASVSSAILIKLLQIFFEDRKTCYLNTAVGFEAVEHNAGSAVNSLEKSSMMNPVADKEFGKKVWFSKIMAGKREHKSENI